MKQVPNSILRNAIKLSPSLKPKLGLFVVYTAESDAGPWTPIPSTKVPDWVKDSPEVMGQLRNGMVASRPGSLHYRAELQAQH